jgi:hypothetical protein
MLKSLHLNNRFVFYTLEGRKTRIKGHQVNTKENVKISPSQQSIVFYTLEGRKKRIKGHQVNTNKMSKSLHLNNRLSFISWL